MFVMAELLLAVIAKQLFPETLLEEAHRPFWSTAETKKPMFIVVHPDMHELRHDVRAAKGLWLKAQRAGIHHAALVSQ